MNKLAILTKKVIYCNECSYEEPNDYYFGVKDWIFAKDSKEVGFHFCRKECYESFIKDEGNYKGELIVVKTLNNNDDKFREIMSR